MLSPKATLRLSDASKAQGESKQIVCRIPATGGPRSVSKVVKRVAEGMCYGELKHGGWAADIGLWGPRLFERDASVLLESMKDRCLAAEKE